MNFEPKTEKELQQENDRLLLPARKEPYPATVTKAVDKLSSKSGNEMIEITLSVFADDGTCRYVTDYLMGAMMHKLFHFAEATGLTDAYSEGTICAEDCLNRGVFVRLGIDPAKGDFAAKNVVKDYFSPKSEKTPDMGMSKKDLPF